MCVFLCGFFCPQKHAPPVGNKRTLRLRLDPAQYHADMKAADMVYETVNLLVRRNAKENNFKGILETIRWVTISWEGEWLGGGGCVFVCFLDVGFWQVLIGEAFIAILAYPVINFDG